MLWLLMCIWVHLHAINHAQVAGGAFWGKWDMVEPPEFQISAELRCDDVVEVATPSSNASHIFILDILSV